jgi:hypothetical protein
MKKFDFETKLAVEIASHRLALLRELNNRDLFYSSQMYDPPDTKKIYLFEFKSDYFITRSDLIFDEFLERFFYVTKEIYEYTENNFKIAISSLRHTENKVYKILSKLKLRGFYKREEFIHHLLQLMPQLELANNTIKDKASRKVFITVRPDVLHFAYKDGKIESYMNLAEKDFNERVLQQCVEIIAVALKQVNG